MTGPARTGAWEWRIGVGLAALGIALALLAGMIAPGDPAALGPTGQTLQPPSSEHWLGTDALGRDVLARLLHGGRSSLLVGWASTLLAMFLGTLVGLGAGMGPRPVRAVLTAVIDLFLSFPGVYLALLLVAVSRPSLGLLVVVLSVVSWTDVGRLVRAESMAMADREFIAAARGLGLAPGRLTWNHVLPNLLPTVLVAGALRIGQIILVESFLSFLGLGPQAPLVTWGSMIAQGRGHLLEAWWLTAFPGLAIALTVLAYNLFADGLRARIWDEGRGEEVGRGDG
jgi:peptide/nickel transport system permease protein